MNSVYLQRKRCLRQSSSFSLHRGQIRELWRLEDLGAEKKGTTICLTRLEKDYSSLTCLVKTESNWPWFGPLNNKWIFL